MIEEGCEIYYPEHSTLDIVYLDEPIGFPTDDNRFVVCIERKWSRRTHGDIYISRATYLSDHIFSEYGYWLARHARDLQCHLALRLLSEIDVDILVLSSVGLLKKIYEDDGTPSIMKTDESEITLTDAVRFCQAANKAIEEKEEEKDARLF